MSLSDKQKQVKQLKKRLSEGKDINVSEEFDGLVDYLSEHGYKIKKQRFPPTTEESTFLSFLRSRYPELPLK